ncbi:MAG: hypothetical protein LC732_03720 [Acidobacteria bacterium]|nr:hypothetical protein [Acidobacteriota bacterium]
MFYGYGVRPSPTSGEDFFAHANADRAGSAFRFPDWDFPLFAPRIETTSREVTGPAVLATAPAVSGPVPIAPEPALDPLPARFQLANLGSDEALRIHGIASGDILGQGWRSVSSAGDVNGDGIEDIILGAFGASPNNDEGVSYVIFGSDAGFGASFDLTTLDGSNGFRLDGSIDQSGSGYTVSSAGDVNGDGRDDLIISDRFDANGYVFFAPPGAFAGSYDLGDLDGDTGFRFNTLDDPQDASTYVSDAGDINGDGYGDVILTSGIDDLVYVVFGSAEGFDPVLDPSSLDGTTGFIIAPPSDSASINRDISSAGDVNGDGIDDIIMGGAILVNNQFVFGAYVVFGTTDGFPAEFDLGLLDGTNGFRINSDIEGFDGGHPNTGHANSAGDVNRTLLARRNQRVPVQLQRPRNGLPRRRFQSGRHRRSGGPQ